MRMPGHNIAWFLALSVAIHTVLLLAYHPALPEIGHAGHIVQLSVERAGSHSSAAVPEASKRTPEIAEEPDVPETRASAQPRPAAAPANPAATRSTATAAIPAGPQAAPAPGKQRDAQDSVPASSAVASGSPQPSLRESKDHLRQSVLELFSRRLDYPAIARRKGWQVTVTLRLLIEPDGRISRLQVDRTSGYPVLDRAAVESLRLASIPRAQQWLHGHALELLVPVEYRLVGS